MSTNENGLFHAFVLDGQGGAKAIDWKGVKDWNPGEGTLWMHMDYSHPKVQKWIMKNSGLHPATARTLLAEDTRPNLESHKQGFLVTLRGVHLQPGDQPENMVAIRLWVENQLILSTQRRPMLSVNSICDALNRGEGPRTALQFMVDLTRRMTENINEVVDEIYDRVDELQEQVLTLESAELRAELSNLRRRAISIRRYLAPQREALLKLTTENGLTIPETEKLQLSEIANHMFRILEDLDSARQRAAVTQEELVSRLTEQMNKRIYTLSIIAAIFLPLSFITGLLGINVGGIPGAENPKAFLYVCILIGVVAGLIAWTLKRRKWM